MTEKEVVKQAIREVLEERNNLDAVTHAEHHRFIGVLVKEHQVSNARKEKIKTQIMGWSIISITTAFVGALGYAVIKWIEQIKG